VACEAQRVNVNDIIVQATAGIMLLALLAAGVVAVYRRWRAYRARRQLFKSFEAVSAEVLRDVLIPDGIGGQLHIDFLLLTGRGLLVVDYRDVEGVVFGGEHMREWAVMNGSQRTTFLNPLEPLYDRIAAVRTLAGEAPVDGRIVFTNRSKFPKGRPPRVVRLDLLEAEYPAPVEGTAHPGERYRPDWVQLVAQVEPSPLARR
jgi:Nuclease-related domain